MTSCRDPSFVAIEAQIRSHSCQGKTFNKQISLKNIQTKNDSFDSFNNGVATEEYDF